MPLPLIDVVHLSKTVSVGSESLIILDDISFSVEAGETVAVVGASGSGKSTLLGILAGLDVPSQGKVLFAGETLSDLSEDKRAKLRAKNLGFVFQDFQLLPNLTAYENIALPLELNGTPSVLERCTDLLKKINLSDRANHYPRQLSGGEQQRIAIARAFAADPKVLLVDEPTGNLDQKTALHITDLLFALNEQRGTTLVCVTHDEALGRRCQRSVRLSYGKIVT